MQITHGLGTAGAATAAGPTVVVDVFRAFSAAAYAFGVGAEQIVLAERVDEAMDLSAVLPGSILMGEDGGVRPAGFDLGNSPGEILADPARVAGKTIVHRSSSGTRCARAALRSGSEPLYVGSLAVASATASALRGENGVTIIAAGLGGMEPAEEDLICALLLEQLLAGAAPDLKQAGRQAAATERAVTLQQADFTHPDDIRLCCAVDRFEFAMQAESEDGLLVVRPVELTNQVRLDGFVGQ
jgi:2-phosphosulfolactate phosphatase